MTYTNTLASQNWFRRELIIFPSMLFIYLILSWFGQEFHGNWEVFVGDESRYFDYSEEIASIFNGSRIQELDTFITLSNGPGYPLYLAILKSLGLSIGFLKLSNAFLITAGCFFLYKTIRRFASPAVAISLACLTAFHPKLIWYSSMIMSESFAFFLASLLVYAIDQFILKKRIPNLLLSSAVFALLILTKVILAYVALVLVIVFAIAFLSTRRGNYLPLIITPSLAILFCTPYLLYTYQATGQAFYWSTTGGPGVYWMSTPYDNEYGDWQGNSHEQLKLRSQQLDHPSLLENHEPFFQSLPTDDEIAKDQAFRSKAIENIIESPFSYTKNIAANILRIFADFPVTYKTKLNAGEIIDRLVGIPVLLLSAAFAYVLLKRIQSLPETIVFSLALFAVYLGGHAFISAIGRMLIPVLPMGAVCIAWTYCLCFKKLS